MFVIGELFMVRTTIAVSTETKEILHQLGEKDESYDEIIKKVDKRGRLEKIGRTME